MKNFTILVLMSFGLLYASEEVSFNITEENRNEVTALVTEMQRLNPGYTLVYETNESTGPWGVGYKTIHVLDGKCGKNNLEYSTKCESLRKALNLPEGHCTSTFLAAVHSQLSTFKESKNVTEELKNN